MTGVQFLVVAGILSLPLHPDCLWGQPSLLSSGYLGDVSPGAKCPGLEANNLPLSCAKVKNAWSYTAAVPYVFTMWCLIKHSFMSWYLIKHRNKLIL
jgi:hypothetical protein